MVDLATLVVKLQAQTAEFTEGLKRGEEAVKHLTETVEHQVDKIVERFLELEGLKKAFEFTEKLVEDIARLDELSHAVGVSAEALSKLQYAGKLEGIDDVIVPFTRMARAAGEALQGNEKLISAFDKLGVTVADLRKLTPEELFDKLAENISKYQDGLGKTAVVQQIFGRGQAAFIALLDKGSEGLKESRYEAELFGVALSDESAHAAKEFGDNFKRIEAALTGVFRQALVEDLPLVENLRDKIVDFAKSSDAVQIAAHGIAEGVKYYVDVIVGLYEALKPELTPVVHALEVIGAKVLELAQTVLHTALPILKELGIGVGAALTPVIEFLTEAAVGILEIVNRTLAEAGPALKILASEVKIVLEGVGETIRAVLTAFESFADEQGLIDALVQGLVESFKVIATAGAVVITTFEVVGKYIAGTLALYDEFQQLPSKSDWLLHPIESTKKFNELNAQAKEIARATFDDINKSFDKGDATLDKIWNKAAESVKKYGEEAEKAKAGGKKPLLELDDISALAAAQKALEELLKIKDKLDVQVNTFGLGSAAATIYDVQFGHISELLAKIGSQSTAQQEKFLGIARAQHIISQEDFLKLRAGLRDGVDISEQLGKAITNDALALEALKNTDAIQKLDEQILKLSGHEKEAAEVSSRLANRQLEASLLQQRAVESLSGLSGPEKAAAAQERINTLQEQATGILHEYEAAASAANTTDEKTQSAAIAARSVALAQLEELYTKIRVLANASGDPELVKQALALQEAYTKAANANGQADIDAQLKRNDELAAYNDLQKQAAVINADLADQIAKINDLQSHGLISELDAQEKEDDARKKTIEQLDQIHEKMGQIAKDSDNPAIQDGFKKMGTSITQLHTQLDQLSKTIRDDFVNESSSAFSDFVLGTKSASAAAKEFLQGIESDLIRLINKHLFEQIFEGQGGGGVGGSGFNIGSLLGLFGGGADAGIAAGADAAATSAVADYSATFALAALAKGGPVNQGTQYLVGEEGPELFLPNDDSGARLVGIEGPTHIEAEKSGRIIPNNMLAGMFADHETMNQLDRYAKTGANEPPPAPIPEPVLPDGSDKGAKELKGTVEPREVVPRAAELRAAEPFRLGRSEPFGLRRSESLGLKHVEPFVSRGSEPDEGFSTFQLPYRGPISRDVQQREPTQRRAPKQPAYTDLLLHELPDTKELLPGNDQGTKELRGSEPDEGYKTIQLPYREFVSRRSQPDELAARQEEPRHSAYADLLAHQLERQVPKEDKTGGKDAFYELEQRALRAHTEDEAYSAEHDLIHNLERRATGGGVSAGQPYLVGEEGPELMVPAASGTVVPNDMLMSKGLTVNNTFHIQAPTGQVSRATQSQIAANVARSVQLANHRNT